MLPVVSNEITGVVGSTLFVLLFLLALMRLSVTIHGSGLRPLTAHKRFYALTVVFAALDVPAYLLTAYHDRALEMQDSRLARICYMMHLLSMWTQVVAVTVVIGLWSRVFEEQASTKSSSGGGGGGVRQNLSGGSNIVLPQDSRNGDGDDDDLESSSCGGCLCGMSPAFAFFATLNVLLFGLTAAVCWQLARDPVHNNVLVALSHSELYNPFVVCVSAALLCCAVGILAYGCRLHNRIVNHVWLSPEVWQRIRQLLRQLNWIMSMCSICFLLRIVMLLTLFNEKVRNNEVFPEFWWHLLSYWIPTCVPAVLLLFLMRGHGPRQARRQGRGGGGGDAGGSDARTPLTSNQPQAAGSYGGAV